MSKEKTFSFTKGYSFSFEDQGKEIEAWFSAMTGLEKVYIDGILVSSQRNLSKDSTNTFSIGDHQYSTNMNAVSLLKGPFICTLSKDGAEIKRQKLVFPAKGRARGLLQLLLYVLLGGTIGFSASYFQLPNVASNIVIILLVAFVFYHSLSSSKPQIENEEIV